MFAVDNIHVNIFVLVISTFIDFYHDNDGFKNDVVIRVTGTDFTITCLKFISGTSYVHLLVTE